MRTIEEIKSFLDEQAAAHPCPEIPDDFSAYDYSGGNYDDAYEIGSRHGISWGYNEMINKIRTFLDS